MRSPMFHCRSTRSASFVLAALVCFEATARAEPTKEQCIDANTKAQSEMRARNLSEARALLQSCLDPQCPSPVRIDCSRRLELLERTQPTIIFDTKDEAGNDVGGVSVTMDGRLLSQRLDGAELNVDPGSHEFVFQAAGRPSVEQSYVLKEFEKSRRELIVIPLAGSIGQAPRRLGASESVSSQTGERERPNRTEGAPAATSQRTSVARPVPTPVYFLAGMAAAGFVDFAIAGTLGNSLKSDLQASGCSPFCDRDKVSAMRKRYLVADLGLAVGIAGLAGTALTFFARPAQQSGQVEPRARVSSEWLAAPLQSGGLIAWRKAF